MDEADISPVCPESPLGALGLSPAVELSWTGPRSSNEPSDQILWCLERFTILEGDGMERYKRVLYTLFSFSLLVLALFVISCAIYAALDIATGGDSISSTRFVVGDAFLGGLLAATLYQVFGRSRFDRVKGIDEPIAKDLLIVVLGMVYLALLGGHGMSRLWALIMRLAQSGARSEVFLLPLIQLLLYGTLTFISLVMASYIGQILRSWRLDKVDISPEK